MTTTFRDYIDPNKHNLLERKTKIFEHSGLVNLSQLKSRLMNLPDRKVAKQWRLRVIFLGGLRALNFPSHPSAAGRKVTRSERHV